MATTKEEWRTIAGREDYEVSNMGNVRRIENGSLVPVKQYLYNERSMISFRLNGRTKHFDVGRLVMTAFRGQSDLNLKHLNGIKTDNRLSNLEYSTHSDTMKEFYKDGRGTTNHPMKKKIKAYYFGEEIHTYTSIAEMCRILDLNRSAVSAVLKGTQKTHKGFTFKIVKE